MDTTEFVSPTSNKYLIYYTYEITNRSTGVHYYGRIKIGEKNPNRNHTNEIICRELYHWPISVRFTKPKIAVMIVKWDIPPDQPYVLLDFTSQYLTIDLPTNLGVSYQDIHDAKFEMVHHDIIVDSIPKSSVMLD